MKSRFKTSSVVGLFIAVLLIITGFMLGAIHKPSEMTRGQNSIEIPESSPDIKPATPEESNESVRTGIALIHDSLGDPSHQSN